jgi:hypothetical protein
MDEKALRGMLADLAATQAPPSTADPSLIFAKGRRLRHRSALTIGLAAAAVVLVAGVSAAAVSLRPESPKPATTSPTSVTTEVPVLPPGGNTNGPFCGWSDTLPATIQQHLPPVGTWGQPQQVSGICGPSAAVAMPVTVAGRTGSLQVVVSTFPPATAKQQACVPGSRGRCDTIADGYLWWTNAYASTMPGRIRPIYYAAARLATKAGVLIDIMSSNETVDFSTHYSLNDPPTALAMSAPPYTGDQLRALALALSSTPWLGDK